MQLLWSGLWNILHIVKTIQVVLDEATLKAADRAARSEKTNRSALIRKALGYYLAHRKQLELERKHRAGYERLPVKAGEFDVWDQVVAWPEE